ncbi:MAG: M48 family metalloprotease [Actinobacteria bacterium]|nr:M48 family metalloprotease [Actinomycetota bacterium]
MSQDATTGGVAARESRGADRPWAHLVLAVGLATAGVIATVWRPSAPPSPTVTTDLDRFGPEVLVVVRAYVAPRRIGALIALVASVAIPVWAVTTSTGRRLVDRLAGGDRWWPARGAWVAMAITVTVDLVRMPVAYALGYVQDGVYGFRTAGLAGWLRDWVLVHGVRWLLAGVGAAGFVWLLRRWPGGWRWIVVWAATAATAAVMLLGPLLFEPLWMPTRTLEDGPVRRAVTPVLERAGLDDIPLLVGDASRRTTKANAYVSGLGPSRRVVLYDTLLELEPDQIAWVVAHEIAHREHRDVARGVLVTATGLLPGALLLDRVLRSRWVSLRFGFRGDGDPRTVAVALAFLAVATVVTSPVANAISRRAEAAADHRATLLTEDAVAAIALQRTFVVRDLADPDRPAWVSALWGTHPAPGERIRSAAGTAQRRGWPLPSVGELRDRLAPVRHPRIAD